MVGIADREPAAVGAFDGGDDQAGALALLDDLAPVARSSERVQVALQR